MLAVQGNFREHAAVLRGLGAEPVEVRLPEQLEGLDGLILPGGGGLTTPTSSISSITPAAPKRGRARPISRKSPPLMKSA